MNKILWKNLMWNYTIRLWYCWKYCKSGYPKFFTEKRCEIINQRKLLEEKLKIELKSLKG